MIVDLRTNKGVIYGLTRMLCGVQCQKCGWRGYRVVKVHKNLEDMVGTSHYMRITDRIKGKRADEGCPKGCGDEVVWTHCIGPVRR